MNEIANTYLTRLLISLWHTIWQREKKIIILQINTKLMMLWNHEIFNTFSWFIYLILFLLLIISVDRYSIFNISHVCVTNIRFIDLFFHVHCSFFHFKYMTWFEWISTHGFWYTTIEFKYLNKTYSNSMFAASMSKQKQLNSMINIISFWCAM